MTDPATDSNHKRIHIRGAALIALLAIEAFAISFSFDAILLSEIDGPLWVTALSHAGTILKVLIVFIAALLIGIGPNLTSHHRIWQETSAGHPFKLALSGHILSFVLFFWLTGQVFQAASSQAPSSVYAGLWLITLALLIGLWLFSLAPAGFWRGFLVRERVPILGALIVAFFGWHISQSTQQLWLPLSALTFDASSALMGLWYDDIFVDPQNYILGTADFRVRIDEACSGYEGIGLVTLFIGFYLSIFRHEFRFPQALLLLPVGILTIWCFNVVRIATLISIGHEFSPDIAVEGFHSQAGWISFVVVSIGIATLAYNLAFFTKRKQRKPKQTVVNTPIALLLPLIVLLATILVTSAFSAGFDWLYPLRVIAVAIVVAWCWRFYHFDLKNTSMLAIATGVLIFAIWLLMAPVDAAVDQIFAGHIADASPTWVVIWLVLRTIGASVTVPIAEELVFRGYLLTKIGGGNFAPGSTLPFSWVALGVTSILFGLLHDAWLAGLVAGLAYGLIRYYRNQLIDAVVAHAVTNLLLSIYVLSTGHWSLW